MSNTIYVHNVCSLQLPRLVLRDGRGLADLLPNEVGKIPEDVAKQPRVQNWITTGRLKVITQDEFEKHFALRDEKSEAYTTYKTKAHPEKQEDGATVVVPGLETLPEVDKIPEPEVTNIDGAISVRAPQSEPLTERDGDPIEVKKESLAPQLLKEDGSLKPMQQTTASKAPAVEESSETTASEKPAEAPALPEAPVVLSDVTVEALGDKPSEGAPVNKQVDEVLALKAWRQQAKALKKISNPEVILQIAEKTELDVIKKVCSERLQELS